jgi:hypothetical protein
MGKWAEEHEILWAEVGMYFFICIKENLTFGAGVTPFLRSRPGGRLNPESPWWLIDVHKATKARWSVFIATSVVRFGVYLTRLYQFQTLCRMRWDDVYVHWLRTRKGNGRGRLTHRTQGWRNLLRAWLAFGEYLIRIPARERLLYLRVFVAILGTRAYSEIVP